MTTAERENFTLVIKHPSSFNKHFTPKSSCPRFHGQPQLTPHVMVEKNQFLWYIKEEEEFIIYSI
jgi:hypothetical protein